jgi:hypothetical protein
MNVSDDMVREFIGVVVAVDLGHGTIRDAEHLLDVLVEKEDYTNASAIKSALIWLSDKSKKDIERFMARLNQEASEDLEYVYEIIRNIIFKTQNKFYTKKEWQQ